jgi:citrate lyase beta subunit
MPEIERAVRLLQAAQQQGAVFQFEGRMVDMPLFLQAQRIVKTARRAGILKQA